jgi:hypothetical protein
LTKQYRLNAQRLALMHTELAEILALFAQNNLPLLPLKGAVLTSTLYPDPGLRPMADLDLLIHPADLAPATQLLAQLGYRPEVAHWKHTEFVKPDNRQVVCAAAEHPHNPRKIELHRRCRESFGGPTLDLTDLMWASAHPGQLLGQPAWVAAPEAMWLHLLVHASYHFWQGKGRLIYLFDLALLIPCLTDPLAWLNRVEARYTFPALTLLNKYFSTPLINELLAEQQTRVPPGFKDWAAGLNLVNASHLNSDPPGLYLLKAIQFSQGHPNELLQAVRFALWPAPAELALDHPRLARSPVPWLAYFWLPLDWARRAGLCYNLHKIGKNK